ncbi:MAG TPA: carbonic anhydrase [Candidatus Baltobacteraceae bacterium]|nr:carbonic anhydrase [Candidatus Baltobacteraceae bacterium]
MQRLIEGVHKFRNDEFGNYRKLFRKLSQDGQNPHTLFITCSDSRVLAELITQSKPGDLFVVKNVGNIVPPASVRGDTNSTAAAIEFAVENLRVDDIVICGHSQCGAISAMLGETPVGKSTPHLRDWLRVASPVLKTMKKEYAHLKTAAERSTAAAEENVLFGLDNLHSYSCVQERLMDGSLRLHGWFFKIATAELFAFDPETRQFSPLVTEK